MGRDFPGKNLPISETMADNSNGNVIADRMKMHSCGGRPGPYIDGRCLSSTNCRDVSEMYWVCIVCLEHSHWSTLASTYSGESAFNFIFCR